MRSIYALIILSAAACTGSGPNPDNCDNCVDSENPDDPNCTDCPVEDGTAEVTYNFRILGDVIDCQLFGNDELLGPTGQKHLVDVGTYTFTAGSEGIRSTDDMPLHPFNGMNWGCERDDAVELTDGDVYEHTCDANVVFAGDYACEYDKYEYDENASDFKGEFQRTVELGTLFIEVLDGYLVHSPNDEDLGVMGNSDHLEVEDDKLILIEADADDGLYVAESEIGPDGFTATVVFPNWIVQDLRCPRVQ